VSEQSEDDTDNEHQRRDVSEQGEPMINEELCGYDVGGEIGNVSMARTLYIALAWVMFSIQSTLENDIHEENLHARRVG
jgi:hypothetical protein